MTQDAQENAIWRVHAASENDTETLAHEVVALLRRGDMVTLSGDLGAGKTTFARAMIRHLLDDPEIEAPSPTFTLMQVYEKGNLDRKSTRLNSSHTDISRMPSSA